MKIGNLDVYGIIYKITNKINGKVYIGQTINKLSLRYSARGNTMLEKIYNYHNNCKKGNRYFNSYLLNSMNKYGLENFEMIECFDFAFSQYELNIKEYTWVTYYNSYIGGYNRTAGGDGNLFKGSGSTSSKSVVCLNDQKIYPSIMDVERDLGIFNTNVSKCCNGKSVYAGNINNNRLVWRFYEDYINMSKKDIDKVLKIAKEYKPDVDYNKVTKNSKRKVICVNNLYVYESVSEATRLTNISSMSSACRNICRFAGRDENGNKLIWMYYDEYLIASKDYINNKFEATNKKKKYNRTKVGYHKPVICVNTGTVYKSGAEAERLTGISHKSISNCCNGVYKSAGYADDNEKLVWIFA